MKMAAPSEDELKKLIAQKDEIEKEIKTWGEILESQKGIGMDGPLLDAEQFPRSDVDVHSIRHARHRIICLQTDHKALMTQIESGLYTVHAEAKATRIRLQGDTADARGQAMEVDTADSSLAFVKVDRVDQGSPAESAGLEVGDLVLKFGSISIDNYKTLQDIGKVVQHSVGKAVSVTVARNNKELRLGLVPKSWSGKGFLGCNIVPMKS